MTPILVQCATIYGPARLCFHNQDSGGGGGLSYLDEFKLEKHCEIVMRSLTFIKDSKFLHQHPIHLHINIWNTHHLWIF